MAELHSGTRLCSPYCRTCVVDMETIRQTNENLINTLDEVLRIQSEGRQKRHEAELELAQIEGQLKNKLLEISR